jgi:hypothetical protein
MQLKILDQVHLSGVRASTLAAGETVEVSDDLAAELLKKHPDKFEAITAAAAAKDEGAAPSNKAEPAAPANKRGKAGKAGKRGK